MLVHACSCACIDAARGVCSAAHNVHAEGSVFASSGPAACRSRPLSTQSLHTMSHTMTSHNAGPMTSCCWRSRSTASSRHPSASSATGVRHSVT
jgi:hypothetical protein